MRRVSRADVLSGSSVTKGKKKKKRKRLCRFIHKTTIFVMSMARMSAEKCWMVLFFSSFASILPVFKPFTFCCPEFGLLGNADVVQRSLEQP